VNLATIIKDNYEKLVKYEEGSKIYLDQGLPYEVGDRFVNLDLANTLAKIGIYGEDAIYKGEIAQAIVNEVQKRAVFSLEDLADYRIKIRKPSRVPTAATLSSPFLRHPPAGLILSRC
jgi:gamma-glutamyltranspeptidase/glutathione hydrolase